MSKGPLISMQVVVAGANPTVCTGCPTCQTVFSKGKFGVALTIKDQSFLVGQHPLKQCCGSKINTPFLFEELTEAEAKMNEVIGKIQESGGILEGFSFSKFIDSPRRVLN